MLNKIPVGHKSIDDYSSIIGFDYIQSLKQKASKINKLKILHLSSTAYGGGVSEMLYTLVPLMKSIGLDVSWQVITGDEEFFITTKNLHNGLQGADFIITDYMVKAYKRRSKENAKLLDTDADVIICHDPQTAAIPYFCDKLDKYKKTAWIWRCHIDLTCPHSSAVDLIKDYVNQFDGTVFSSPNYIKPELKTDNHYIVYPAIDPLSPKNMDISSHTINELLSKVGIKTDKPVLTQVSRFDPWKDPLGVIDVYREVKKDIDLQLLMVASMASDDPEGWHYFEKTARHAGNDLDIHLLSNVYGVGNLEVNAIQKISDVVIQKSVREGFGLVVSEALWKGKPVVGTNVGGIAVQIVDGDNGFLIENTTEAVQKILWLLSHKQQAIKMGKKGKQYVKQNFISPRNLMDIIDVIIDIAA